MDELKKAKLILDDGSVFYGFSFGFEDSVSGEVVFNTGMTGYPETLTDPSYKGQILVMTYPLIGNYGIPEPERNRFGILKNFESEKIHLTALIVSDYSFDYSHWSAKKSLSKWLIENNVPGIFGIDTRALTKVLREKGVMLGKVVFEKDIKIEDPNVRNLVEEVSIERPVLYEYNAENKNELKNEKNTLNNLKIILIDCGVKNNIINSFLNKGVNVLRVRWDYDFANDYYEGLVISNCTGVPNI